jgi:hypothetical protein
MLPVPQAYTHQWHRGITVLSSDRLLLIGSSRKTALKGHYCHRSSGEIPLLFTEATVGPTLVSMMYQYSYSKAGGM